MKGLGDMMKQAQKMQENMETMQQELKALKVQGNAGAGLVSVTMTGKFDVTDVAIDDSLMSEEKEMLEDLLAAAVNDAVRKVEAENKEKMASLTGGMPLPPGFRMPF